MARRRMLDGPDARLLAWAFLLRMTTAAQLSPTHARCARRYAMRQLRPRITHGAAPDLLRQACAAHVSRYCAQLARQVAA